MTAVSTIMTEDYGTIAKEVYAFSGTEEPLAVSVKEALAVIDDALDTWGCVFIIHLSGVESRTPAARLYLTWL